MMEPGEQAGEDALLREALSRLAYRGPARSATKLTAKLLRKDVHTIDCDVPLPSDEALSLASSVIATSGQLADTRSEVGWVRGVLGAGAFNLNPAVVTISVAAEHPGGTLLRIRGAALEGIIRQRAGTKAVERVKADLLKPAL